MRKLTVYLFFALTLSAQPDNPRRVTPADVAQRTALVIGNDAYPKMPLANGVNDARGVAAALGDAGFKVKLAVNADSRAIDQAVQTFVGSVQAGDVALFYYSGHGIQIGGENYLVPVNFDAVTETDARYQAFPVARISDSLQERGARLKIVILDACRDNPFRASRSGSRGLAAMTTVRGSFVAFATDPGRTADDNPGGANGLFTKYLIQALRVPGLKLEEVFNRAREGVERDSAGRQVPWTVSSVLGDFYFRPVMVDTPTAVTTVRAADQNAEIVFWNSIKDSKNPTLFRAYLDKFPNGVFKEIAEVEVASSFIPRAGPSPSEPAPTGSAAVETVAVEHLHVSFPGYYVEGRLRVGAGKLEFQEHGKREHPEHNFSVGCGGIQEPLVDNNGMLGMLINNQRYKFSSQDAAKAEQLIRGMCEDIWFQRSSGRKK